MQGSVSGPPEPVSGSLERRLGRRNDSPVGRNESRGRRNDARRGVNAARVRANEQWEAVSFRYRFCETVLASCKRCRSHCLLRENLPDIIDDLCIRSRSWSAPFFCLPGHRSTIASWRTLSGAPGILPGQPYPNSALHWRKSAHYDTPPTLMTGKALLCPISQARSGSSGYAIVSFTVGVDGKSHDIQILKASYPYFGSHTV